MKGKSALRKTAPFLVLAVLLTGCQTNTFTHRHFQARVARIHSVGLLPQVHTAVLNTYFGFDHSPAPFPEEQQIRSELRAAAIDQLQRHGFIVKESSLPVFTNQIWNGRKLQQACATPLSKAARPDAKALANDMNVDGLIFLDATAYISTPHRQKITTPQNIIAFLSLPAILVGPPLPGEQWQGAQAQITLVDGKTGDVLWTAADYFSDFETNKPAKQLKICSTSIQNHETQTSHPCPCRADRVVAQHRRHAGIRTRARQSHPAGNATRGPA